MAHFRFALLATIAAGLAPGAHAIARTAPMSLLSGNYTTPAASAELAEICPTGTGFPAQWTWSGAASFSPQPATSGTPKIEQYRAGKLIAKYTSFADQPGCQLAGDGTDHINPGHAASTGCGPFTRTHSWRLWEPGDKFLVYPAVYTGEYNQPYIGQMYDDGQDFTNGITHTPDNITLQGVVQNNRRPVILLQGGASYNNLGQAPVYFDRSNGFTMDSIDVMAAPGSVVGKAGVYEVGGSNLTLSNMRIAHFARAGGNGLFGADQYSGTLRLDRVELDHNGGDNGPAHNAYIGASMVDPNFTVVMTNSWSHDAYYGHLFKSRAQNNVFVANYFQGGEPTGNHSQAEAYLLDIPNGGTLVARNNLFAKSKSGDFSNGMSLTFLMEGVVDSRAQSIDVENNTFVGFSRTFDGVHQLYPMSFLYPNVRPDSSAWPSNIPTRIIKNAFVGYCPSSEGGSPVDYRGTIDVTESFKELSQAFQFSTRVAADDKALAKVYANYQPVKGTPAYVQLYDLTKARKQMTLGAED